MWVCCRCNTSAEGLSMLLGKGCGHLWCSVCFVQNATLVKDVVTSRPCPLPGCEGIFTNPFVALKMRQFPLATLSDSRMAVHKYVITTELAALSIPLMEFGCLICKEPITRKGCLYTGLSCGHSCCGTCMDRKRLVYSGMCCYDNCGKPFKPILLANFIVTDNAELEKRRFFLDDSPRQVANAFFHAELELPRRPEEAPKKGMNGRRPVNGFGSFSENADAGGTNRSVFTTSSMAQQSPITPDSHFTSPELDTSSGSMHCSRCRFANASRDSVAFTTWEYCCQKFARYCERISSQRVQQRPDTVLGPTSGSKLVYQFGTARSSYHSVLTGTNVGQHGNSLFNANYVPARTFPPVHLRPLCAIPSPVLRGALKASSTSTPVDNPGKVVAPVNGTPDFSSQRQQSASFQLLMENPTENEHRVNEGGSAKRTLSVSSENEQQHGRKRTAGDVRSAVDDEDVDEMETSSTAIDVTEPQNTVEPRNLRSNTHSRIRFDNPKSKRNTRKGGKK